MQTTSKQKKKIGLALILLILINFPGGCADPGSDTVSKSGFYFDTIITITLYGTEDASAIEECFSLAETYEKLFSNTIPESDISRINASAGAFVAVDPETVALIQKGISYGKLSEGRFDITLGVLSDLWNFSDISAGLTAEDNEADASVLPDASAIADAISHIDYRNIIVDEENQAVCLLDPGAKLDLGGIAKGYIADRMKDTLLSLGITSAIINLGGNVLAVGSKPNGDPFHIGIQKPFADANEILDAVEAEDITVVTSGVYQRYYRIDGKLYHHLLDVSTGYPYDNGLTSVTILCDQSVDGDGLSTVCFALGLKKGLQLVESLDDVEAIFVDEENGIHKSSGLE